MPKLTALEKIEEIKKLRKSGYTFREIADVADVSDYTAYNYSSHIEPEQERQIGGRCMRRKDGRRCERPIAHRGIHQTNDKKGRLINWE